MTEFVTALVNIAPGFEFDGSEIIVKNGARYMLDEIEHSLNWNEYFLPLLLRLAAEKVGIYVRGWSCGWSWYYKDLHGEGDLQDSADEAYIKGLEYYLEVNG